jgi:SAM-dependent methyltransferase
MPLFEGARKRIHLMLERRDFSRRLEVGFIFSHLDRLDRGAGATGLDIACGLGTHTLEFADRRGGRVVGLDFDAGPLAMARLQRRPGSVEFLAGDSQAIPCAAAAFDYATSVCAFEHFPDDRRAFAEAARVLRPGGLFLVTVDSLSHPAVTASFRERHRVACRVSQYYTAESLRRRLDEAGFDALEIRYLVRGRIASLLTRYGLWSEYGKTYLIASAVLAPFIALEERLAQDTYGYKLGGAARRRGAPTTSS